MIEKKIDIGFSSIKHILHISDIHVRNLKRHKEYRSVFKNLYAVAKKLPKESIIYIGGDIAHAKTQMSPELIQVISDLLVNLANIRPTIVILGNHDLNLNNSYRLDALTPIINNINHPNLHFLKESGNYKIADINFGVMSVFDKQGDFISAKDINGTTKIALFHGTVAKSQTDFGFKLDSDIKIGAFRGYDMALLGDIHRKQFMNKNHTIAYCGSLIQQNHGEDLDKGALIWNVEKRSAEFVPIRNDYGYYTLDIDNGVIPEAPDMPKHARLRLRVVNTDGSKMKRVLSDLRQKYGIKEITINRMDTLTQQRKGNRLSTINVTDIANPNVQFDLIKDYLSRNYIVDKSVLTKIKEINDELNNNLPAAEVSRNIQWKLKHFEFDNMFSYGEGNEIEFDKLNGIIGIFAPNTAGKSSLLDAISFCLFDTCSRAFKANHVLNNKKKRFSCKAIIEINGTEYYIERTAKKQKSGHVKVDVNFSKKGDHEEIISLNSDQRRSTNANIRKVIGTYEDFILTTLSLQNNFTVFIDKTQKERKELLAQFMGIGIFDLLYQLAHENIADVKSILKNFAKRDFSSELSRAEINLKHYTKKEKDYIEQKKIFIKEKKKSETKLNKLIETLKPIDESVSDIDKLLDDKTDCESALNSTIDHLSRYEKIKTETEEQKNTLTEKIKKYVETDINEQYSELLEYEGKRNETKIEIDKLKISVRHKLETLDKLHNLEYDPDCEFCMKNVFVLDAIKTRDELKKDKLVAKTYIDRLDKLDEIIAEMKSIKEIKEEFDKTTEFITELQHKIKSANSNIAVYKERKQSKSQLLEIIKKDIERYYEQEQDIIFNRNVEKQKNEIQFIINNQEEEINKITDDITNVHGNKKVAESQIKNINNSIEEMKNFEEKFEAYELYLDAIKRDGVPYELIVKALPTVEAEVNNILAQIVDFSITLEMDGKNINTFLVYDEDNTWPLELCGGMEKFISSLAIRVGLINVSNLPLSNFLALDEGFGTLDGDNLNSIYLLFQYLKTRFQFILIVSHVEGMRDSVDSLLEIEKKDGFSKINFKV